MPADDDPLSSFVRKRLQHARALWSKDIDANYTKLQFADWLLLHVDFQTDIQILWPENDGSGWDLSLQLLRLACGFPPVANSKGRRRKK